nr:GH25 family lysozyme [Limosilactobacillus mucosae]
MTMANVIDISEYQDPAKFDYQAAKSNGIKAVIIRLSVGNRRDNHAAEHIANCKKYGLKWHGYHYWYNLSGEAAFAISDAQSLGLTSSQYFFLDMEDKTLSSDWSAQFESFRSAVGGKYKVGLYCSDSPYKSHFDNAKMVAEGVYRWIAAYSYEPANYDTWQMSGEGSGGFGSYTGDVDRDYDKTGNLFKEEAQPITPSTTPLYRQIIGEAGYDTDSGIYGLGRSYDNGKTFHVMDTVYGRIYRQQDGDSIWPFLQPKIGTIKGEKGDAGADGKSAYEVAVANGYSGTQAQWLASLKGADGAPGKDGSNGKDGQTWQPYIADDKHWHIRLINNVDMPAIVGVITQGNANDLTMDDSYRIDGTVTNIPSTSGLLTIRANSNEVWQTYIDSATADCYTRTRHNGTWTAWRLTTQWS